jgi:hypothetical protein
VKRLPGSRPVTGTQGALNKEFLFLAETFYRIQVASFRCNADFRNHVRCNGLHGTDGMPVNREAGDAVASA